MSALSPFNFQDYIGTRFLLNRLNDKIASCKNAVSAKRDREKCARSIKNLDKLYLKKKKELESYESKKDLVEDMIFFFDMMTLNQFNYYFKSVEQGDRRAFLSYRHLDAGAYIALTHELTFGYDKENFCIQSLAKEFLSSRGRESDCFTYSRCFREKYLLDEKFLDRVESLV